MHFLLDLSLKSIRKTFSLTNARFSSTTFRNYAYIFLYASCRASSSVSSSAALFESISTLLSFAFVVTKILSKIYHDRLCHFLNSEVHSVNQRISKHNLTYIIVILLLISIRIFITPYVAHGLWLLLWILAHSDWIWP